jgi:hypothetical protein
VTDHTRRLACAALLAAACAAPASAQDKPADSKPPAPIVFKLQVVVTRFEGDKKISSMPYMLSVNAGRPANLRMGTRVPIVSTSFTPIATGGAGVNPLTSYQYTDIGTNIDCSSTVVDAGKFRIDLTIEDSSVYPEDQSRSGNVDRPSFRSFRATNSMVLKDGETTQFTSAVDKITGIVTKVDVTLTVVK